ncbi:MAG: hypothetical protein NVSMB42_19430 [Herpetosiphon sp.]
MVATEQNTDYHATHFILSAAQPVIRSDDPWSRGGTVATAALSAFSWFLRPELSDVPL